MKTLFANTDNEAYVANVMAVIEEHTQGAPFTLAGLVREAIESPGSDLHRELSAMNKRNGIPTTYTLDQWLQSHSNWCYDGWHTVKTTIFPKERYRVRNMQPAWQIDRAYDPEAYAKEQQERIADALGDSDE